MDDEELVSQFEYPDGTLKNLLHIHDQKQLAMVEFRMVAKRSIWLYRHGKGKVTMEDFAKINKFLFGHLYSWAGQYRDYYLSKDGTDFLPPASFQTAVVNINDQLKELGHVKKPSALQYATILDSLNFLHPFREGNGRTTRLFLQLLAANHSQYINYHRQDQDVIDALNNSDLEKLSKFLIVKDVQSRQAALSKAISQQLYELKHRKDNEKKHIILK